MRNIAAIKAKRNAHYICQECGATDSIQIHHRIPGDDSTIIVLCGECHSKKHPEVPKSLFLSIRRQRYWFNKSASSLARELRVHPRTIIRTAKRLKIYHGELNSQDEELIKTNIHNRVWEGFVLASQAKQSLGLSRFQLDLRIKRHILPAPTYTDPETQIRYFDENWVQAAKLILAGNNQRGKQ
jgi:hypothetical protein